MSRTKFLTHLSHVLSDFLPQVGHVLTNFLAQVGHVFVQIANLVVELPKEAQNRHH